MTHPHHDDEFGDLVRIVAEHNGLSVGLVEKDYWVTHALWGIQETGFELWFKGGTSLSKGFGLISRFSEDLDVRIDPGSVSGLVLPDPWAGRSRTAIRRRIAYFESLAEHLVIPDMTIRMSWIDEKSGLGAMYEGTYPGSYVDDVVSGGMRPFVLIEAGRARVTPFIERDLSSFIHDYLREEGHEEMLANLALGVRCIHPLVTLFDKLDAISRRFERGAEPETYARHYEDAARIVLAFEDLPPLEGSPRELALAMRADKDIRSIPSAENAALNASERQLGALEEACEQIKGVYWERRIPVSECCDIIQAWLRCHLG